MPSPPLTPPPPPSPPAVSVAMARAHRRYWRFNLLLIAALMTLGFMVSFVAPMMAPAMSSVRIGGFRLPFYVGAQGAILVYLALILVYILLMQRADRQLQRVLDAQGQEDAHRQVAAASGTGAVRVPSR